MVEDGKHGVNQHINIDLLSKLTVLCWIALEVDTVWLYNDNWHVNNLYDRGNTQPSFLVVLTTKFYLN